jgi:hypothetical protein
MLQSSAITQEEIGALAACAKLHVRESLRAFKAINAEFLFELLASGHSNNNHRTCLMIK